MSAILTTLYQKGTRQIIIVPCITYAEMTESRKKLNAELKTDYSKRNYWKNYRYAVEVEEIMNERNAREKIIDREGRSRTLLTNKLSLEVLMLIKKIVLEEETKEKSRNDDHVRFERR